MTESGKALPDSYVPNAYALPYGSNLSAPAIKPDHSLGGWKVGAVHSANQHYEERFEELRHNFEALVDEVKWNEIIFNSEFRFKPVIGKEYYLYQKENKTFVLTLFAPYEKVGGYEGYKGTFKLNYDNRWELVRLPNTLQD